MSETKTTIKANQELFQQFHLLSRQMGDLSALVQNDQEINQQTIDDFTRQYATITKSLHDLFFQTMQYIGAYPQGD